VKSLKAKGGKKEKKKCVVENIFCARKIEEKRKENC
jgi:hypothetical protein